MLHNAQSALPPRQNDAGFFYYVGDNTRTLPMVHRVKFCDYGEFERPGNATKGRNIKVNRLAFLIAQLLTYIQNSISGLVYMLCTPEFNHLTMMKL